VLVRHARTAWNFQGRAQGHTDVPLDDVGREQARALAPYIVTMAPSRIVSSDLARARETAEVLGAATGLPVTIDARLREFDVGERAGLSATEFAEKFPAEHAHWLGGHVTGMVPGAETVAQVTERMVPALREVWEATGRGETSVVVTHGASLRVCMLTLLGLPEEHFVRFRAIDNCGWVVLEEAPGNGGFRLASYNETAHPAEHGPDFASDSPIR
jgi:probable phosphoglycerate mutase